MLPVQEWPILDAFGWTIEQVQSALTSVAGGYLYSGEQLLHALDRDPVFAHGRKTRTQARISVPHELEQTEGLPDLQFEELVAHLPDLWAAGAGPSAQAVQTRYRISLGAGPVSVAWKLSPSGRTWLPVLHAREAGWLSYDATKRCYLFSGRDRQHDVIPDGKEWLLFCDLSGNYPHMEGLIRPLAAVCWYKAAVLRYWYSYARAHGSPARLLKYPAKMRETDDVAAITRKVRDLAGGAVVPLPQYAEGEPQFDFSYAEAKASTWETFPSFLAYCDKYITICWLGAWDNTQGDAAGSRARAEVHERVSLRYLAADCAVDDAALSILWRQWCRYNRIAPSLAPRNLFHWQPPADREAEARVRQVDADALGKAAAAAELIERHGQRIDWQDLAVKHGLKTLPGKPIPPTPEPSTSDAEDDVRDPGL